MVRITKSQYREIAAKIIAFMVQSADEDVLEYADLSDDEKQILSDEIVSRCSAISPDGKTYGSIEEIVQSVLNK